MTDKSEEKSMAFQGLKHFKKKTGVCLQELDLQELVCFRLELQGWGIACMGFMEN